MEIAKSAGFNFPQFAALELEFFFTDTPWLAAGKFIWVKIGLLINIISVNKDLAPHRRF